MLDSKSAVTTLGNPGRFPTDQLHSTEHDFHPCTTDVKESFAESWRAWQVSFEEPQGVL